MKKNSNTCQPGSVRKCKCPACKPLRLTKAAKHKYLEDDNKCKCEIILPEKYDQFIEEVDRKINTGILHVCKCVSCNPHLRQNKIRTCFCIHSEQKFYPSVFHKVSQKNRKRKSVLHKSHSDIRSKDQIIQEANEILIKILSSSSLLTLSSVSSSLHFNENKYVTDESIVRNKFNKFGTAVKITKCGWKVKLPSVTDIDEFSIIKRDSKVQFTESDFNLDSNSLSGIEKVVKSSSSTDFHTNFFKMFKVKSSIMGYLKPKDSKTKSSTSIKSRSSKTKHPTKKHHKIKKHKKKKTKVGDKKSKESIISEPETEIANKCLSGETESTVVLKKTKRRNKRTILSQDPNKMYYSKYISASDTKRIIYAIHRLLHNYVMFRCGDRANSEGIISERFLQKLSDGFELFLKNAYFYDPYYQPISFKRRYGYIEIHIKIGTGDLYANQHRMFKKVFLVIFHRGVVKYVLTRFDKPGYMDPKEHYYALFKDLCREVWCRVDFITCVVCRQHRRVSHKTIEGLFDTLIDDEKGFYRMSDDADDVWTCIDFDTELECWSKTERGQFIKMMRIESDPYFRDHIKHVPSLETKLDEDRRRRKRTLIKETDNDTDTASTKTADTTHN